MNDGIYNYAHVYHKFDSIIPPINVESNQRIFPIVILLSKHVKERFGNVPNFRDKDVKIDFYIKKIRDYWQFGLCSAGPSFEHGLTLVDHQEVAQIQQENYS